MTTLFMVMFRVFSMDAEVGRMEAGGESGQWTEPPPAPLPLSKGTWIAIFIHRGQLLVMPKWGMNCGQQANALKIRLPRQSCACPKDTRHFPIREWLCLGADFIARRILSCVLQEQKAHISRG